MEPKKALVCEDCGRISGYFFEVDGRAICPTCNMRYEPPVMSADPRQAQLPEREKGRPDRESKPL